MNQSSSAVQLGSIQFFCKAAELESFTAAAEIFGVTPAAISRSVRRIEERLGVRLFARSTRQIKLTDQGRLYYEQCRQALLQIGEAEAAISGQQASPSGIVRLSIPTTYGHYRVLPLLPTFHARYPGITLDINLSNRNIDFIEEGYDLAIRAGQPADSRLIARKLEDAAVCVFAAPAYLQQRGTPQTLEQLQQHDCIQFILPSTGKAMPWVFKRDGVDLDLPFDSKVRFSEDVLGCVTYAKAGGGICQIFRFIAEEDLEQGTLVELLQPFAGRFRAFSLLYQQNRHQSASVRALIDFMVTQSALLNNTTS
ncbi:MAG: LysR substrate-binding domain-containing protein [Pseudomonadota bacterium]